MPHNAYLEAQQMFQTEGRKIGRSRSWEDFWEAMAPESDPAATLRSSQQLSLLVKPAPDQAGCGC